MESDPAVSQGNDSGSVDFMYGADGNRVVQSVTSGGVTTRTIYVGLGGTGRSLYEQTTAGTNVQDVHFIYAGAAHGGAPFALRVLDSSGTSNRYYSFDHLGSVTALSDDQGHVSAAGTDPTVLGYDAWGARRNPDGTAANPASFNLPVGDREFTGQEQIPDVGLVNLNGRVYDPSLGRFLSPDPNVQFTADLQSYNRYSYAGNNPLRYSDPTGYFWSELGNFFSSTFSNPMMDFQLALSVAACVGTGGAGCIAFGLMFAGFNAFVAIANGAGFDQTILNTAIGLGVGLATGGLGQELGLNAWTSLIMGSASAAVTTGISNALSGKSFFQYNVLGAAFLSAAQGAVTLGLQELAPVSKAGADQAQGGGSGAARVERLTEQQSMEDPNPRSALEADPASDASKLADNPKVEAALDKAWRDSYAENPSLRHEEGGWIYQNATTGEVDVRFASPGEQAQIVLNDRPEIDGSYVVGKFHTHPNPTDEGWEPSPSPADTQNAWRQGVPSLIRSDMGDYVTGPASRWGTPGTGGLPIRVYATIALVRRT